MRRNKEGCYKSLCTNIVQTLATTLTWQLLSDSVGKLIYRGFHMEPSSCGAK